MKASLTSITIPDGVTTIGLCTFSGCSSLTSIVIPESVTSIGNHVFAFCDSMTSVVIPASITSVGDDIFLGGDALTDIYYMGSEDDFWNSEIEKIIWIFEDTPTIHFNYAP